jgi:ribonucleoside-diphosphate reductase alpha chain
MPYISWIEEINRHNPNKHEGMIVCVNLCVESFSVVDEKYNHTCNIASVVVGRVPFDELAKYAAITTRILDNGIALTKAPTVESKAHNERYRTVGVGVQGLADILAREGKGWGDEEFVSSVFEEIQLGCVQESVRLAEERGVFPAFKGSDWDNGVRINNFAKHSKKPDVWIKLQERIDVVGIRNSQLTSPAPNTSTAIAMDAGAGVMPVYAPFFYEDNKDGVMPVCAMLLKENPLHYARDVTKFNPASLTKVVGWAQRFVDTGISAEYVMDKNNPSFSAKTLWDTLQSSWENKNKAVYYIRTIKEGEQLVQGVDACVGCAG